MIETERWRDRAARLGVATDYVDVDGTRHAASDAALRVVCERLLDGAAQPDPDAAIDDVVLVRGGRVASGLRRRLDAARGHAVVELDDGSSVTVSDLAVELSRLPIGIHGLRWSDGRTERSSTVIVSPRRFPSWPDPSTPPGNTLFAPAYALWARTDPRPSFDMLARLGAASKRVGVDTIATLPLYAPGPPGRFESSPYSPISRFHWNELLIPDRLLERPATNAADSAATADQPADRVDWSDVQRIRLAGLDRVSASLTAAEQALVDEYVAAHRDVASYARFVGGDRATTRRYEVGQWLAERALDEVVVDLEGRGQRLALDLPVGARLDGWERVTWPERFVDGVCIGAPPDTFFADGQDWQLPAIDPAGSRRTGHRVWHDLLERACRYAGLLRIDHIMQVHRLWWIPDGHSPDDGVYVHYPADELLAVAAIVAERTGTLMVGEDLGTVPDEVAERLADWGLPGMYEEVFTLHATLGTIASDQPDDCLTPVRARSWGGIRTHDMPSLARTLADLDSGPYRTRVAEELGRQVGPAVGDVAAAMVDRLRAGGVLGLVVDLDDVLGDLAAHNHPGVVDDANWTHRAAVPVDELADDPRLRALLDVRTTADAAGRRGVADRREQP